jgi:hypothetical protein
MEPTKRGILKYLVIFAVLFLSSFLTQGCSWFDGDDDGSSGKPPGDATAPPGETPLVNIVTVTVKVEILDDEKFWPDEHGAFEEEHELVLTLEHPHRSYTFRFCVGDEVVTELTIAADQRKNSSVDIKVDAYLYEGTNCETDDQEAEWHKDFALAPNDPSGNMEFKLYSAGVGGGDYANFTEFTVSNRAKRE